MRLGKTLHFIFQSITAGLAAALVVLLFFPGLLQREAVVEIREGTTPAELQPPENPAKGPVSYAQAVAQATPAVVNIHTAKRVRQRLHPLQDDPVFQRFFGETQGKSRPQLETSLGSGVIISSEGYILTNNHVIAGAEQISVMLKDGRSATAQLVGSDSDTDLAVLRIQIDGLPAITINRSDGLKVGDVVLAIGNPFGIGQTVTMGIVSATGRSQLGINTFEDFIQTDAAINPGNSGGALINPYGQLVGINTAIFSRTGGSQGIGFAIPVSLAGKVMEEIIEHGYVVRGWLGVEGQELTPMLAQSFGLRELVGVVVSAVARDGPAQRAGIEPGDVITQVNGVEIDTPRHLMEHITQVPPGNRVALQILRSGQTLNLQVAVSQRPNGG